MVRRGPSVYPTHVGMNRIPTESTTPFATYTPRTWGRGKGYITREKGEPDFEKLAGAAKAEGQYQLFVY